MKMPATLALGKYLLVAHLAVFTILALQVVNAGQPLQLPWVVHIAICFSLVFRFREILNRQVYFLVLYCIAVPAILFYKVYHQLHASSIEPISIVLVAIMILTPLAAAPLIWFNRSYSMDEQGKATSSKKGPLTD